MTIFKGSRYDGAEVTEVKLESGEIRQYLHDRPRFRTAQIDANASSVTWAGDTELDSIAYTAWSQERLWWLLADANNIMFPFFDAALLGTNEIKKGMTLVVPSTSAALGFTV